MQPRNKKGQFSKRQQVIKVGVVNKTTATELPTENKDKRKDRNIDYIKFGSDNLFPQAAALITRRAATHRAILNFKNLYVSGGELNVGEENAPLLEYISSVNDRGESLKAILDRVFFDYNAGGNAYLEIATDSSRSFMNLYHKDWTTGRVAKGGKDIIFNPDWANRKKNDEDDYVLPIYPEFEEVDGALRSVIHFKSYEPEFVYYGLADWMPALDSAGIAYKTNKWNISRLDNSFNASGVLMVDGDINEKDAAALKDEFEEEFTGEGQTGKVLMMIKDLGGGGSDFTPITSTEDGNWLQLHSQSRDELIAAHQWFQSLSAVAQPGQLGNNQLMRNEYQYAHNTTIAYVRSQVMPIVKMLLNKELNLDTSEMEIKNLPSVSLLDLVNANKFVKIWEARKEAGLDFDEDAEDQQSYIEGESRQINL